MTEKTKKTRPRVQFLDVTRVRPRTVNLKMERIDLAGLEKCSRRRSYGIKFLNTRWEKCAMPVSDILKSKLISRVPTMWYSPPSLRQCGL